MPIKAYLLAVTVASLWGLNFVVVKIGLATVPPFLFSAIRFFLIGVIVSATMDLKQIPWKIVLKIGLLLGILQFSLLFYGIHLGVSAGMAGLIIQSQVLFTILINSGFQNDRPSRTQILGMISAAVGIGLLLFNQEQGTNTFGVIAILLAALSWSFSNIITRYERTSVDGFRLTMLMTLIPPIPLFLISYFLEGPIDQHWSHIVTINFFIVIFYTCLVSTVFGFGIWNYLMKKYSPNIVAPFGLLVPVVAILTSVVFLNEELTHIKIGAITFVILGLGLMSLKKIFHFNSFLRSRVKIYPLTKKD